MNKVNWFQRGAALSNSLIWEAKKTIVPRVKPHFPQKVVVIPIGGIDWVLNFYNLGIEMDVIKFPLKQLSYQNFISSLKPHGGKTILIDITTFFSSAAQNQGIVQVLEFCFNPPGQVGLPHKAILFLTIGKGTRALLFIPETFVQHLTHGKHHPC